MWTLLIILILQNKNENTRTTDVRYDAIFPESEPVNVEVSRTNEVQRGEFTAYSMGDGYTPGTVTASGKNVYEGGIANNCLPFGTIVDIDGKKYIVEDRMAKRYGCDNFDIYMDSRSEALQFGRKTLNYQVLTEEEKGI